MVNCYTLIQSQNIIQQVYQTKWLVNLRVNGCPLVCRIDTGAKCNTLTTCDLAKVASESQIDKSPYLLRSYTNHTIKPVGSILLDMQYCDLPSINVRYEIIDIAQESVISGDMAEKLNLLRWIYKLIDAAIGELTDVEDIPDLANCTRTLPGTYSIKVNPSVEGVIHPPYRQPATLK